MVRLQAVGTGSCLAYDYFANQVFGFSNQFSSYQRELADRLCLPFLVLSDHELMFCNAMRLPTFEAAGMVLIKRVTLIANESVIEAVHYPIFPSNSDPQWVIDHLAGKSAN